jgi:sugar phosphate isomerase/epimerase
MMFRMDKTFSRLILLMSLIFATSNMAIMAQQAGQLYEKPNLVAWCIVPFDKPERTSEQRCLMLKQLGITRLAYDWRERHVPNFDTELEALKNHNIKLQSFWYYSGPEPDKDKNFAIIIDLLKRHKVQTEIWTMITGIKLDSLTQEEKVEAMSKPVRYIAEKAREAGCTVGLYNHGDWFGEPENQLAIINKLKMSNVGIVYNFSHSEYQIHRFPEFFPAIRPHLYAINITGLKAGYPAKVVPVGQGDIEFRLMKLIEESGYKGPIGIINEDFAPDARDGLMINLKGIEAYQTWKKKQPVQ